MPTQYDANLPYDSHLTYDGQPETITTKQLPTYLLRATALGGQIGPVPDARVDSAAFEFSEASAISFSVPAGSIGFDLVDDYTIVDLIRVDSDGQGAIVDDGRWLLRNVDDRLDQPHGEKSVTGKHLLWDALERTIVWHDKRYFYGTGSSPGLILNDLFQTAKNRGARLLPFTWTFTQSVDSAGNAWPEVISMEYKPGTTYESVVANLVEQGLIEVRLRGWEIQVYAAGKMGVHRAGRLVVGHDITEASRKKSAERIRSHTMVVGEDDNTVVVNNPVTEGLYGREEGVVSQGGTSDIGTMTIVGEADLSGGSEPRVQRAYTAVLGPEQKMQAIRDYAVSDTVPVVEGIGEISVTEYRVRQIVLQIVQGQVLGAALVLNDKFLESEIRLAKKVNGIIGGAVITGSSRTSTPDDLKDKGVPLPPAGIVVTTESYLDVTGVVKVVAMIQWNPVVLNVDGTAANDIEYYSLRWRYSDEPDTFTRYTWSDDTIITISGLDPGRDVVFFMYVNDTSKNFSAHTATVTFETAGDTTAPQTPSTPTGTSRLKTATFTWDGLGVGASQMPSDLKHVQVWTSLVNDFDPQVAGRLQGMLSGRGDMIVTGYEIDDVVFAKLIAVDNSGNKSAPSAQVGVTIVGVTGPDIEANSITANELAAGSVTASKIEAGAVTTDKLTVGQTFNLVPDPGFADAGWRNRRLTTEFAEIPAYWFFRNDGPARNGYHLQFLSTAAGVNGGRMYMTPWMEVQPGEQYYVAANLRDGHGVPNAEARLHIGMDFMFPGGSVVPSWGEFEPTSTWERQYYKMTIETAVKIRYWVRAWELNAGDFIIDDFEVRCMLGTTALTGSRIEVTALGMFMWDSLDQQTLTANAETGDFGARGTLRSGFTGKRIEINPGDTYLPEIRFYPDSSPDFAYINAGNTFAFLGLNSPDNTPGVQGQTMILHEDAWWLGQVDRVSGSVIGPGLIGGQDAAGYLWINGVLPPSPQDGYQMLYGSKFSAAANTQAIIVSKPVAPLSGTYFPVYSLVRQTTTHFEHHIIDFLASSYTIRWNLSTTITTNVHELVFRGTG